MQTLKKCCSISILKASDYYKITTEFLNPSIFNAYGRFSRGFDSPHLHHFSQNPAIVEIAGFSLFFNGLQVFQACFFRMYFVDFGTYFADS